MADYQTILDAIDSAIQSGVSRPGSFSIAGRTITYNGLADLLELRKYYQKMLSSSGGIRVTKIRASGA